jgi:hypothetical protein
MENGTAMGPGTRFGGKLDFTGHTTLPFAALLVFAWAMKINSGYEPMIGDASMELVTFVKETLCQILAGVKAAHETELGSNINAATGNFTNFGQLIDAGNFGVFTRVDFDVAVTGEVVGKGEASIKVFSLGGIGGGGERRAETASRVSFTVPLRLPSGDQSIEQEQTKRAEEARAKSRNRVAGANSWMA